MNRQSALFVAVFAMTRFDLISSSSLDDALARSRGTYDVFDDAVFLSEWVDLRRLMEEREKTLIDTGGRPCHGENECCTSSSPCWFGEGDCDSDSDCLGSLICAKDSCRKLITHPWMHVPVGDYSASDDCCVFTPGLDKFLRDVGEDALMTPDVVTLERQIKDLKDD